MKLYKDISFWCIVLALVVVMVVHHFLSKGQLIEGNTNEKCGAGSDIPCCWYNMWQSIEGDEDVPPLPNTLENLKTDGTVYLPLSIGDGSLEEQEDAEIARLAEEGTEGTWEECQQRCIESEGCVYFNRFPNGFCFLTDGRDGNQIGIDPRTGDPSQNPELMTSHSGKALETRENIPESQRFGLEQCKCAATGEKPEAGWPDTGTPIDQSALQYGDNRISSEVDCSSTPEESSCDAYGRSIPNTIDLTQATHFRCLVKSEVDKHLRDKATNLGVDISGIDTNSNNFQSTIRGTMLDHMSIRESYDLDDDAPQSAIDNLLEEKRLLRLKYSLPLNASDTDIKQKQDERRIKYNVPLDASEEDLEEAIINRETMADFYGIDASSENWEEDREAAMELQGSTALQMEQAKYCIDPLCGPEELAQKKREWNEIRQEYNLPHNATPAQVAAAIVAARLYDFETHTFTNCQKTGRYGPTIEECKSSYGVTDGHPFNDEENFNVTGYDGNGIQVWRVPVSGEYDVDVYGASGGGGSNGCGSTCGGRGARIKGRFTLTKGDYYWIIVGQMGTRAVSTQSGGGGGGGSFFVKVPNSTHSPLWRWAAIPTTNVTMSNLLIAAGGGGGSSRGSTGKHGEDASGSPQPSSGAGGAAGASYSPGGGGGFLLDGGGTNPWGAGVTGGYGFKTRGLHGGEGSSSHYPPGIHGGFGGGGGSSAHAGGGGGGATGGSGPPGSWNADPNGRAGTSYTNGDAGMSYTGVSTLSHPAHGQIIITLIEEHMSPPPPPQPNTLENIHTDGRWYMPLNGIESDGQTLGQTLDMSWEECRDRCLDTPDCVFFNRFNNGGCHITDGHEGHVMRPGNPTSHSGSAAFMEREVTLPMSEETDGRGYTAATGNSGVNCSNKTFLGVADSIRHNGHSANWGNRMIDIVAGPDGDKIQDYRDRGEEIPCENYYYYKPHTLSNLSTEEGGGWVQSAGDNGEPPSGFYTLQHTGQIGQDNCTNYAVRNNTSTISDYACSDQGSRREEDPSIPNPSEAILQGLAITSDN